VCCDTDTHGNSAYLQGVYLGANDPRDTSPAKAKRHCEQIYKDSCGIRRAANRIAGFDLCALDLDKSANKPHGNCL
jgi:hypothetical protein